MSIKGANGVTDNLSGTLALQLNPGRTCTVGSGSADTIYRAIPGRGLCVVVIPADAARQAQRDKIGMIVTSPGTDLDYSVASS